ncbi:hypothetical protein V8B97DRAFT_116668 [Scleroderma yunnanense]
MASSTSLPLSCPEEHFDKAKKHLWATDPPSHGHSDSHKRTEHRETTTVETRSPDDIDCHLGQIGSSSGSRSPQSKARPEPPECIFKALPSRSQHVLPPLSREGFNFDQDRRLPPPRCWNITEHSPLRERPTTSFCTSSSFLPEERARNECRQQRPSYPVSLSVFNSPTATYMWPSFQAASQMRHPPVIYVNYDNKESTRSASVSSVSSLHDSPIIPSPATIHADRLVTNMLPKKRRSSSPDARISPDLTPTFRTLIEPLSHVVLADRDVSQATSPRLQHTDGPSKLPRDKPLDSVIARHPSTNSASSEDDHRVPREDSPQVSETSERSLIAAPVIRRPSPKGDAEAWERYAKPTLSPDGATRRWQCTWTTTESGRTIDCNYTSKKQLVKRHVETTHLRFKPFICEVCKKGFPQKTSLDTHMHGHTGSTPHVCRYGCGMAFKDPARRHRHMVEEHGYVPRQSKKKHKVGQPVQDIPDSESRRPWNLEGGEQ